MTMPRASRSPLWYLSFSRSPGSLYSFKLDWIVPDIYCYSFQKKTASDDLRWSINISSCVIAHNPKNLTNSLLKMASVSYLCQPRFSFFFCCSKTTFCSDQFWIMNALGKFQLLQITYTSGLLFLCMYYIAEAQTISILFWKMDDVSHQMTGRSLWRLSTDQPILWSL